MDGLEGIRHCDKAAIRLTCLCGNDGLELRNIVERRRNRLRAERRSDGYGRAQVIFEVWRCGRVEQEADPLHARSNLLEQLQPLAGERSFEIDETGDVAAQRKRNLKTCETGALSKCASSF